MFRLLVLILTTVLLQGCPATTYALLKNESGETVRYVYTSGSYTEIASGEEAKVVWKQGCLVFETENGKYTYKSEMPPDENIEIGIFATKIRAKIGEGVLVQVSGNENLLQACG